MQRFLTAIIKMEPGYNPDNLINIFSIALEDIENIGELVEEILNSNTCPVYPNISNFKTVAKEVMCCNGEGRYTLKHALTMLIRLYGNDRAKYAWNSAKLRKNMIPVQMRSLIKERFAKEKFNFQFASTEQIRATVYEWVLHKHLVDGKEIEDAIQRVTNGLRTIGDHLHDDIVCLLVNESAYRLIYCMSPKEALDRGQLNDHINDLLVKLGNNPSDTVAIKALQEIGTFKKGIAENAC